MIRRVSKDETVVGKSHIFEGLGAMLRSLDFILSYQAANKEF